MIERADNRNQICCDTCPASYPNTYADEDFAVMVSDAKTAGWLIRQAKPDADRKDTSDLFGARPRLAGTSKPQRYTHTCPACARPATDSLF
ncbi:hypothetical protein ASD64_09130 [Mesorhizobium sp. Root157]|uniref:hypothetical protein n=1 Tax=Mesorhizobium sp. Root157 TaxID=1736477 RepID=UPI0006FA4EA8|nr:hypothetical protein [Mesorhizobium sp. Root157]KQZ81906.1 hypothetical protein ASD64_09130 [Mesorhizobium sp. Root157]